MSSALAESACPSMASEPQQNACVAFAAAGVAAGRTDAIGVEGAAAAVTGGSGDAAAVAIGALLFLASNCCHIYDALAAQHTDCFCAVCRRRSPERRPHDRDRGRSPPPPAHPRGGDRPRPTAHEGDRGGRAEGLNMQQEQAQQQPRRGWEPELREQRAMPAPERPAPGACFRVGAPLLSGLPDP